MSGGPAGLSLEQQADAILARSRGVAGTEAIEAMRAAIAAWLAARPARAAATDIVPDARHARRLLMEAMDRAYRDRGIG